MTLKALFLSLFLITANAFADARMIVHLTDYLANDYAGAVSSDGKVLSEVEYAEQIEFAQTALKEGQNNQALSSNQELIKKLEQLAVLINSKTSPDVVVPLAREIQAMVIKVAGIALSPSTWPDMEKAQKIYQANCIQCHGHEGRGDGPDGKGLDPAPSNFHDLGRAPIVSPFAAFNTIRLGVPGTGMLSFSDLSEQDIWSLAFYVSSFRYGAPVKSREPISKIITNDEILTKAAALNDVQLRSFLIANNEDPELVKSIRTYSYFNLTGDYVDKTDNFLTQAVELSLQEKYEAAGKMALDAYFLGIEPLENKLAANDPALVTTIEEKMAAFRNAIKAKDHTKIKNIKVELTAETQKIRSLLSGDKATPAFAFVSGFSIILREGFEAVLVILAILGVAKASGSAIVVGTIHAGWVVSLLLGVIGWFLSGWLMGMSGVSREIMEAAAAFFAVFVLLYVGFWMHRQTEISRWKEFVGVKVKNLAQTKNLIGLFTLSFIVTFREVIETILFLRSVALDAEGAGSYIFAGVICAFALVLFVSIMISKYRNKIPLHKFFTLSSILMLGLSTVLTGKGIHALHEAALFPMTPFPVKVRLELLGIYPTWETLISQVFILIASYFIWKRASKKS